MNVLQTMEDVHRHAITPSEVLYVHVWLGIHWVLIADHAMVSNYLNLNSAFISIHNARHQ